MLLARARCPLACQAPCRHAGSNEALPATRAQPLLRLRGSAAARGMAPAGRERRRTVRVDAFSLLRNLNVPKPRWLPDFGLPKRCAVLDAFFNISDGSTRPAISRDIYEELLAPDFRFVDQSREAAEHVRQYFKADFVELMCECVAAALPDFSWSAATDGEVDRDGYCIVEVQISAHHTGAPFALPGLPVVPAGGQRVAMEPEFLRVRVEEEKIKEIVVLPTKTGAGPLALYRALAGEPPAAPV